MEPVKDTSTVFADGKSRERRIEGLIVRPAVTLADQRGELVEVFSPAWGIHPAPLVYVYQVTVAPSAGRGWTVHEVQDDRIFHNIGTLHWAFYDDRPDSPTRGVLNKITLTEHARSLIIIPKGVYHACVNFGLTDAIFINMPTEPYNHADPDKYRLPLKNDLIPYDFTESRVR